jgi:hypothetical protein
MRLQNRPRIDEKKLKHRKNPSFTYYAQGLPDIGENSNEFNNRIAI